MRVLGITVVSLEQPARYSVIGMDHDLAGLADRDGMALFVHDINIVQRRRFAHGAGPRFHSAEGADAERSLGLAEAFHDRQAGRFADDAVHFGVECLACCCQVADTAQVIT